MATASFPSSCKLPGCTRPQFVEHGVPHDFCGKTHADMYRKLHGTHTGNGLLWHQILAGIELDIMIHALFVPVGPFSSLSSSLNSKWFSGGSVKSSKLQPLKAFANKFSSNSTKQPVKFYNSTDPYYEFTNFYRAPIELDGHRWPTTEHYFQAQKFIGTPYYDYIRSLASPKEAFLVPRNLQASKWVRADWMSVKDDIMLKALRAKFTQNDHLKHILLDTKQRELVEHTSNDTYWGDGGDGSGQNKLGKLLMQVRTEIKDKVVGSAREKTSGRGLKRSSSFSNLSSSSLSLSPSYSSLDDSNLSRTLSLSQSTNPVQSRLSAFASPMTSRKTYSPHSTSQSVSSKLPNDFRRKYLHSTGQSKSLPSHTQPVLGKSWQRSHSSEHCISSTSAASPRSFYGTTGQSYGHGISTSIQPHLSASTPHVRVEKHSRSTPALSPASSFSQSSTTSAQTRTTNTSSVGYNIITNL